MRVVVRTSSSAVVMLVTRLPRRIFVYSSGVLFSSRIVVLVFMVGWLVPARVGVCLPVSTRGLGVCGRLGGAVSCAVRGVWMVFVWVASRERACLCEVCGRVGDVEGVAFVQELFCF